MKRATLVAVTASLIAAPAYAQFEIEDATTESQSVEMELLNTVRVGGIAQGQVTSEHEVGVSYGALRSWEIGIGFQLEKRKGEQLDFNGLVLSSKVAILGGETSSQDELIDLAVFSEFTFAFDDEDDHLLTVGPAVGVNVDPVDVDANVFFEIPVSGDDEKVGLEYALGAMYAVNESLSLGLEAHGEVPNVFNETPAVKRQEHMAGPALSFTFEPEPDREVGVHLGTFVGLTSASPKVGLAANLELGF